jgi:hypothetical protein
MPAARTYSKEYLLKMITENNNKRNEIIIRLIFVAVVLKIYEAVPYFHFGF